MFNLSGLKSLSSIKRESVKVHAGNSFISAIKEAKQEIQKTFDETDDNYNNVFMDALNTLEDFSKSEDFDANKFDLAVDKLSEAINLKSTKAEPYFYLAWLFHFALEDDLALKYLRIATTINPEINGASDLKTSITSTQLDKQKNTTVQNSIENKKIDPNEQKVKLEPLAPRKANSPYGQYGNKF